MKSKFGDFPFDFIWGQFGMTFHFQVMDLDVDHILTCVDFFFSFVCFTFTFGVFNIVELRTVPTKYKGFCARLGPRVKSRSLQGLRESPKKNWSNHAFFRDN